MGGTNYRKSGPPSAPKRHISIVTPLCVFLRHPFRKKDGCISQGPNRRQHPQCRILDESLLLDASYLDGLLLTGTTYRGVTSGDPRERPPRAGGFCPSSPLYLAGQRRNCLKLERPLQGRPLWWTNHSVHKVSPWGPHRKNKINAVTSLSLSSLIFLHLFQSPSWSFS